MRIVIEMANGGILDVHSDTSGVEVLMLDYDVPENEHNVTISGMPAEAHKFTADWRPALVKRLYEECQDVTLRGGN